MNKQIDIETLQKDLPQLIVALDSPDETANYIHIADAKENVTYYCPCCKGIVKPRAYKNDKEYQVQPHFYHENGGCNEETFVHYICKTWLFEKGCKFKIGDNIFTVDRIETEKTYNTDFGGYRPDITVYTTIGKVFFFEIKYSNKKTEHYIPKWDELGNDVVEVDARYFINQKFANDVPEFKLIYSDGECFMKSYTKADYDDVIAKRKLEWKRQDKLNYKIMWERLDWFWISLQEFKEDKIQRECILNSFKSLDFYDVEDCWNIISKMACCRDIKDECRDIVNEKSKNKFEEFTLDIEEKYKEKIIIKNCVCKPKKNLQFDFCFTDKYGYMTNYYSKDYIQIENKAWIIKPSDVVKLFKMFSLKENNINVHCDNIEKIDNIYLWNNAPMLFDKYIFSNNDYSCISKNDIFGGLSNDMYITNFCESIAIINKNIINSVSKSFINNFCMNKSDIENYISKYIKEYLIIDYNFVKERKNNIISYNYNGCKIIEIKLDDKTVCINDEIFYYQIAKKEKTEMFINECIKNKLNKFTESLSLLDMIVDIKHFSNNTWKFDIDFENELITISLNYSVPVFEKFRKKVSIVSSASISDFFKDTIKLNDYRRVVSEFLDNVLARVMKDMVNAEIEKYNNIHLTSALYKSSEVKIYD